MRLVDLRLADGTGLKRTVVAGLDPWWEEEMARVRHRQVVMTALSVTSLSGMLAAAAAADDHATAPLERVRAAEARRIDTIERVLPSVVCVLDSNERDAGSGVLIDPEGYGLTNYHVIAGLLDTRRGLGGLADGLTYELEVLGIDVTGDVAMFRLMPPKPEFTFPFAALGDSDAVRVGDTAIAIGNPFALAEDYTPTVTLGIVTGVHRYQWGVGGNLVYTDCLQVDAPINPGNSGGPLFSATGEVIGINGRISVNTRGRYNVGFGYAISANQIKRFIPALRAGLLARHGTWQATVEEDRPESNPTPPETSRALDGDVGRVHRPDTNPGGPRAVVRFDEVRPQGPAYEAGVRVGDTLLSLDGTPIRSANQVGSLLGTYPGDWPVRALIEREGKSQHLIIRLEPVDPQMRRPFEVDRDVNRRAVTRVLRSFHRAVLGHETKPRPADWKWIAERQYHPLPDGTIRPPERYEVTQSGDGPIRMQQRYDDNSAGRCIEFDDRTAAHFIGDRSKSYEMPPCDRLVLAAVYTLYRRLLEPPERSDSDVFVAQMGADLLVAPLEGTAPGTGKSALPNETEPPLLEVLRWPLRDLATARLAFDSRSFALLRMTIEDTSSDARITVDLTDYRDIDGAYWPCAMEVRGDACGYRERWSDWELSW